MVIDIEHKWNLAEESQSSQESQNSLRLGQKKKKQSAS